MADDKKSKSDRRYGNPPKGKGKKADASGHQEEASKKAESTAGSTDGSPGVMGMDSDPGPEASDATGTAGIPVHDVHMREMKDMHSRHESERTSMHTRHEAEHKKMMLRHTAEVTKTGSSAKTAGEKADATAVVKKNGSEG